MTDTTSFIPSDLARAARAISQVSAREVAARAGLDKRTVRDYERGRCGLSPADRSALRAAFEELGVRFIDDSDEGGYGVRRRFSATKVKQLERWEGEGGPAADDDI